MSLTDKDRRNLLDPKWVIIAMIISILFCMFVGITDPLKFSVIEEGNPPAVAKKVEPTSSPEVAQFDDNLTLETRVTNLRKDVIRLQATVLLLSDEIEKLKSQKRLPETGAKP